jgi:hypothetical protein
MLPAVAYAGTGDAYDNPFSAAATVAQDANVASCKLLEKLKFAPVAQLDKASDCGFKKERFGETAFASHCVELRSFAAKSFQTVETTVKNPAQRDSFRFTPSPLLDLQLLRCGQAFIQFCSAACDCVRQFQSYGFDVRFE